MTNGAKIKTCVVCRQIASMCRCQSQGEERKAQEALKFDSGKVLAGCLGDMSLALLEVSRVASFGAKRYGRGNWQDLPNWEERYGDAKWRHLLAQRHGEIDEDSGLLHLAHEAWNVLAVLELKLRETPILTRC